jgi:hypothetical protein
MAGYKTILKISNLEKECDDLGFILRAPKYEYRGTGARDAVAVGIKANALPLYARDAELFVGTLEELDIWLNGVRWSRSYYKMLGLVDDKKIARKEQDVRNKQIVNTLTKG